MPGATRGPRPWRSAFSTSGCTTSKRHARARDRRIQLDRGLQPIGEADALDLEVALDQLQFVGERQMTFPLLEQRAQQLAEAGDQPHDARRCRRRGRARRCCAGC